ncbi:cell wall-binding repeat-containing protein [Clostridium sp. Mt-5]|uniref:Cell wall-binding repeat-containing protein n=1 Tax=Clostridium moutaii TaxID=3240932 RepID=A0ABV4BKV6_9CLOT
MYKKFLSIMATLALSILLIMPSQIVNAASFNQRLAGQTRYETAVKVVQQGWTSSDYVVLASGQDFPDALSAAPLAKKYDAPILLTGKSTLDSNVKSELQSLATKNVFLIGGTGSISSNVESQLKDMDITVTRIAGSDRFQTSLAVAKSLGDFTGVVLVNAYGFADALSIAPVAASQGMPIILTTPNALPSEAKSFLDSSNYSKSYILGGNGAVGNTIASQLKNVTRIGGPNRYATNAAVLKQFEDSFNYDKVYVVSGENYPDALCGSALAAKYNSPLILVGSSVDTSVIDAVKAKLSSYGSVIALGGKSGVSDLNAGDISKGSITQKPTPKPEPIPQPEPMPVVTQVTASIDNANPKKNSTIYLTVTGSIGSGVTAVCNYKTTTTPYSGTIGSDGKAVIPIKIGRATSGYTVVIDVTVGSSSVQTSFTPQ